MRTFLLAVDGSKTSELAVEYCRDLLEPGGDRILAVNVVPMVPDEVKDEVWDFEFDTGTRNVFEMESELMDYADDLVSEVVSPLVSDGFEVDVQTRTGHPGTEICEMAGAKDVAGIVMGRSGKGVVSEMVLGSVSHYVVHHSTCPVILVPARKFQE